MKLEIKLKDAYDCFSCPCYISYISDEKQDYCSLGYDVPKLGYARPEKCIKDNGL